MVAVGTCIRCVIKFSSEPYSALTRDSGVSRYSRLTLTKKCNTSSCCSVMPD